MSNPGNWGQEKVRLSLLHLKSCKYRDMNQAEMYRVAVSLRLCLDITFAWHRHPMKLQLEFEFVGMFT